MLKKDDGRDGMCRLQTAAVVYWQNITILLFEVYNGLSQVCHLAT